MKTFNRIFLVIAIVSAIIVGIGYVKGYIECSCGDPDCKKYLVNHYPGHYIVILKHPRNKL